MSLAVTGCTDAIEAAQDDARANLRLLWLRTSQSLNDIPLNYGTPSRSELLASGVPPLAPPPGVRTAAMGSTALALTTRLTRGAHSFTVDLFLLAVGSEGSGDLSKQRSAYACVRVIVAHTTYRLVPKQVPCRHDLPLIRDPDTVQHVSAQDLQGPSASTAS